jgi:pimeloyl-ACP methyl ester carboxylesterase
MKRVISSIRLMRIAVVLFLSLPLLVTANDGIWEALGCNIEGENGGEKTVICIPPALVWKGDLVVYAHGYVAPQEELELPTDELMIDDETFVPAILMGMGYAFATTSFSTNGYAVKEGASDINALVEVFKTSYPDTDHVFVLGASEGGLIATMLVEEHHETYDGGLALCGPVGGMPYQIQYLADFRVVFDYFFKGVFHFGAIEADEEDVEDWDAVYMPAIERRILSGLHSTKTKQLFEVVNVPEGPTDGDIVEAAQDILKYNIKGFNDLIEKAGGNPYDNRWRWYRDSDNDWKDDWKMNLHVERVQGDSEAKQYVRDYYKPTGDLKKPLVTLHTEEDPIVPYRHELIYFLRTFAKGNSTNLVSLPVLSYGHCNFTPAQVLGSFGALVWKSTGSLPYGFEAYLESM